MTSKITIMMRLAAICCSAAIFALLRTSTIGIDHTPPVTISINPTADWTAEQLNRSPNIIVVLSEAFWDLTQIKGLKFSRDPIPTFHALQEKYTNGTMLSPQFGGGTANVELEVLTGNSMRFLPKGSIAYETVIDHKVDSLASILSRQGYAPTVISPFFNWYFDSFHVYQRFGFSRFIPLEFFNPNEFVGPYIGDHAVAKRIIEESRRSAGPDFIFANTMENHYHYYSNKFKSNTISIEGNMPGEALAILETYAQGANGADNMLKELVNYYGQLKEPTIVVFFGDHLPQLESDYFVYRESKYIQGTDDPDFLEKMYNVPVLIWNNYMQEQKETLRFSPSFLSPYILRLAKLPGSDYTDFLNDLSKRIPVIPPKPYYEALHINEADLSEYESRQEQILASPEEPDAEAETETGTYIVGYGDPLITSVVPDKISFKEGFLPNFVKSTTLMIKGGRFGIGSILFADDLPLRTTWLNEDSLIALLPKELYRLPGSLKLEVRVVDEKDRILAHSQPYMLHIVDKSP
jgi:hypothetical protein